MRATISRFEPSGDAFWTIGATVLTLLVSPTVYEIHTEWRDWIGARVFKSRPDRPAHAGATPREPVTEH